MPDPADIYIPEEFESERLIIRTPRPGDGAAMNAAIRESINELKLWMPWADHIPEVAESEAVACAAYEKYKAKTDLWMLLLDNQTGTFIGSSGLVRIDWNVPAFEIGYWVRTSCAGQGYITEAVNAITKFAFEQLGAYRVCIKMNSRNTRSRMVAERTGFEFEGTLRNDARMPDGSLRDTLIFSKIRREE
ncbi:MAG: GNAT family N-acetyltransferase [Armatimonadota bacterium]